MVWAFRHNRDILNGDEHYGTWLPRYLLAFLELGNGGKLGGTPDDLLLRYHEKLKIKLPNL